jgi:dethiobiotin synthetase
MQPYFITSTGTGIGKTLITSALCWQLRQQGRKVTALKPVISGYSPVDMECDSARILKSCGITPTPQAMEALSPWRYGVALAPNMAARIEGNPLNFDKLVEFCREHMQLENGMLLVEGVGGVMVPLTDRHTVLDWMQALDWPLILVAGSYLGSISHTLTAFEVIRARGLTLHSVVLCESCEQAVDLGATADTLESFLPKTIPVVKIPRIDSMVDTWKHVPPISWMCQ